jgi:hypothetical protein
MGFTVGAALPCRSSVAGAFTVRGRLRRSRDAVEIEPWSSGKRQCATTHRGEFGGDE